MSTLKTNNIQHVDRSDPSIIINTDGSVNIAGTMTYEDVTNVDAVGIITGRSNIDAQKQVHVGTGVSVKAGGINVTAGITTVQDLQATTLSTSGNITIAGQGAFTGNLDVNSDTSKLKLGAGDDFQLYHNGSSNNIFTNNGNINLNTTDAAAITFSTNGSERVRFHSGGNVGINEDTPDRLLHITHTQYPYIRTTLNDTTVSTGDVFGAWEFESLDSSTGSAGVVGKIDCVASAGFDGTSTNGGAVRIHTSGTNSISLLERVRITQTGDVNIGGLLTQTDSRVHIQDVNRVLQEGTLTLSSATTTDGAANNGSTLRFHGHDGSSERYQASIRGAKENGTSGNYAGYLAFNTRPNGTGMVERMRITSEGAIGVGLDAPVAALQINSSKNAETDRHDGSNYHLFLRNPADDGGEACGLAFAITSNTTKVGAAIMHERDGGGSQGGLQFFTNGDGNSVTERVRITDSGQFRAGDESSSDRTSFRHQLSTTANSSACLSLQNPTNSDGQGVVLGFFARNTNNAATKFADITMIADETQANSTQKGSLLFKTNVGASVGTRFMVNNSGQTIFGGNTGVGGGQGGVRLQNPDVGTCRFGSTNSGQITYIQFINGSSIIGSISGNNGTAYNTTSDYRLKENETAITDGITRLKQLKPYKFNWKSDSSTIVDGFFAHEVSSIIPEAVTGTKDAVAVQADVDSGESEAVGDPLYQQIDQSKLVPLLTAALQEEVAKREELEARVASLESAIRN